MNHAHDIASYWLLAGVSGWFLLTFVLQLGKGGAFGIFISTIILSLITIDIIASFWSRLLWMWRRRSPPWQALCLLVLLPYALSGLRIYWLIRRRRRLRRSASESLVKQIQE